MVNIAVVLAGCGHQDGAEIRESVITLLALDQLDAKVTIYAPDIDQHHVINHLTGEETNETRNVLVESARIARGGVEPLEKAHAEDFDALIMPGGFGAAKNLANIALKGKDGTVDPVLKQLITAFYLAGKPIGAICIAPAILTAALAEHCTPHVTIGDDRDGLIEGLGGKHQECATRGMVIDDANNLVTCSAYMRNDRLSDIALGIEKLVEAVVNKAKNQRKAA